MAFPVLVDACVLVSMPKTDLMLRLADAQEFRVLWSEEILDEVERNLITAIGLDPMSARRRVDAMRSHFPDAMVEDYEGLIPAMTNHEKDRHVLAAAVRANAELIVTDNKRDFPPNAVKPYEISVSTPDDFLLDQLDLSPDTVLDVTHQIVRDMKNPVMTWSAYCEGLQASGLPLFSRALAQSSE